MNPRNSKTRNRQLTRCIDCTHSVYLEIMDSHTCANLYIDTEYKSKLIPEPSTNDPEPLSGLLGTFKKWYAEKTHNCVFYGKLSENDARTRADLEMPPLQIVKGLHGKIGALTKERTKLLQKMEILTEVKQRRSKTGYSQSRAR